MHDELSLSGERRARSSRVLPNLRAAEIQADPLLDSARVEAAWEQSSVLHERARQPITSPRGRARTHGSIHPNASQSGHRGKRGASLIADESHRVARPMRPALFLQCPNGLRLLLWPDDLAASNVIDRWGYW